MSLPESVSRPAGQVTGAAAGGRVVAQTRTVREQRPEDEGSFVELVRRAMEEQVPGESFDDLPINQLIAEGVRRFSVYRV